MTPTIELPSLHHPDDEDYLPFQKAGITEMFLRNNVLLADEMGLGKTIQMAGYINAYWTVNKVRPRVLYVCPKNLTRNVVFEMYRWLDPALLEEYGDIEFCNTAAFFPSDYIVASFEGFVKWRVALKESPWDVVIVDEAHNFKNRGTKRAQALFEFRDIPAKKFLLTGTPIPNYPYELFPLVHWLSPEQWPSAAGFEQRYCPYKNKYAYNMDELQRFLREGMAVHVGSETQIVVDEAGSREFMCRNCPFTASDENSARRHVSTTAGHRVRVTFEVGSKETQSVKREWRPGLMIRRLKKEVLPELPRKRRQIIELPAEGELLELVEKENELWAKAEDEAQVLAQLEMALKDLHPEAKDDTTFESLVEQLKFNKSYLFTEISLIRHQLAKAKVPYIIEHLEDLLESKEKVVLFIHHRDVGEAIADHFNKESVKAVLAYGNSDVHGLMRRFWEDDEVNLFIGSLKAAGVGLNLQIAHNVVFAELDWVPGVITQAEDRCHRIGQDKQLLIQHLVAQNSMDSKMAKTIINKQKNIGKALDRPVVKS